MKIKNNIIDQLEPVKDNKSYAVNITLKSGEVIYLESLTKGEKDGYLGYVKIGTEVMLIEIGRTIWRIMPEDIEKMDVKAYSAVKSTGIYPVMKVLMAKSRMESATFLRFIVLFVAVFVLALVAVLGKSLVDNEIMNVLFDSSVRSEYLQLAVTWIDLGYKLIIMVMLATNILDLILKPVEAFHIIDNDRHFLSGTKTLHVLITFGFMIGYTIFMIIFNRLLSGLM